MEVDAGGRAEAPAAPTADVTAAGAAAAAPAAAATTAAAAGEEQPATTTTTTSTKPSDNDAPPPPAAAAAAAAAPSQDPPAPSQPREADHPAANDVPQAGAEPQKQDAEAERANDNAAAAAADAAQPPPPPPVDDDALLASFFAEVKSADRDAEVNRILGAFKLNPYEQLGVRFDADPGEVGRAYRKASLLVHPDKCSHPRASDAFDLLGAAAAALRDGAEGLDELRFVLDSAREQVRAERKKEAKKDGAARLAALVVDGGAAGVQAAWERSEQFHERWRALSRDLLARNEFKRRKLTLRLKETEERLAEEAKAERKKAKAERKGERAWERSRAGRVGAWRDFAKGGGGSKSGGTSSSSSAAAAAGGGVAKKKGAGSSNKPPKGLPSSWNGGVGASSGAASAAAAAGAPGAGEANGAAAAAAAAAASLARDPERPYVRRPAPGGESF